jgi:enediyne biosynthesis protein E5
MVPKTLGRLSALKRSPFFDRFPLQGFFSSADARNHQLFALGVFLLLGNGFLHFQIPAARIWTYIGICLWTQAFWSVFFKTQSFQWKSALITSFSLSLLMRTESLGDAALIGALAISSKFLLRTDSRPFFNPAHFGVCMGLLFFDHAWVSPGQWGALAFMALLALSLGTFVSRKADRLDVSFSFLGVWAFLLIARSLWLNEPMSIPFHRLQTGALLLFAFHMISDPMTTPKDRWNRLAFGALVAFGAFYIQFSLFRTNGLLWSLLLFAPMVKFLDAFTGDEVAFATDCSA